MKLIISTKIGLKQSIGEIKYRRMFLKSPVVKCDPAWQYEAEVVI